MQQILDTIQALQRHQETVAHVCARKILEKLHPRVLHDTCMRHCAFYLCAEGSVQLAWTSGTTTPLSWPATLAPDFAESTSLMPRLMMLESDEVPAHHAMLTAIRLHASGLNDAVMAFMTLHAPSRSELDAMVLLTTYLAFTIAAKNDEPASTDRIADMLSRLSAERDLSKAHAEVMFNTMFHGVVYQDNTGRIIAANPAAEEILGRTVEELRGLSSYDFERTTIRDDGTPFPPSEHPAIVTLRTGKIVRNVVMGVQNPRTQSVRWINIDSMPLLDNEGHTTRVYTLFQDITALRSAHRATAAFQEKLTRLAAETLASEERHRNQVATAVHDGIGHGLAVMQHHLRSLADTPLNQVQAHYTKSCLSICHDALKFAQNITFDLSPPILNELGLPNALRELTSRFADQHQLNTVFCIHGDIVDLGRDTRMMLYRTVQELLINVVKHAHATTVRVTLCFRPTTVIVRVLDNGCGFIPDEEVNQPASGGFGLFSIQQRARLLNASLRIRSRSRRGSSVQLTLRYDAFSQAREGHS